MSKNSESVTHHRLADMREERVSDTLSRKLVVGKNEMLGFVYLKKGSIVPVHKHVSEQITLILEGSMEFTTQGKKIVVNKDEMLVIPSNVEHAAVALEDTLDLDCFSPLREDWLTGNDLYLRKGSAAQK